MRKLLLLLLFIPGLSFSQGITESQVKTQISTKLARSPRLSDHRNVLNLITDYVAQADSTAKANVGGGEGGGPETDPVYSASPAAGITAPNIANWLTAYSWGNHQSAGYQTTGNLSTDLTASASKYPSVNAVNTGLSTRAPNLLTGYISGSGEVTASDNVLQAIQKINGNVAILAGSGFVSANSVATFSNKSGNISQWNNDSGYLLSSTAGTTYQSLANLAVNLTPSATNYPSVNAVNTGLALKGNLSGGNTWLGTQSFPSTVSFGNVTSTELSYLDGVTSGIQSQFDLKAPLSNPTFAGTVVTGNLNPSSSSAFDLGASGSKWVNVYTNRVNASGTLSLISGPSSPLLFSQTSPTSGIMAGFSPTDGKLILQSVGTTLTASTGEGFQNYGTSKQTGNALFGANVTMSAIPTMSTKPATSLVPDGSGNISSRTNAQHFNDIFEIQSIKRIAYFEAVGNGTTTSNLGSLLSTQGTATTRNVSLTNYHTGLRRIGYVGATSANAPAGLSGNNAQYQVLYGFSFRAVFSIQGYNAGHRYYAGMGEGFDNAVEPSTLVNRLHMYADAGDLTWKIRGANASQGTVIELGANFPVNTSTTDVYDVTFNLEAGGTSATYVVRRLNTGDVATGTISTVPAAVLLRPQVIASNAATGVAASIDIARVLVMTDN